jgi:hypothetical protein
MIESLLLELLPFCFGISNGGCCMFVCFTVDQRNVRILLLHDSLSLLSRAFWRYSISETGFGSVLCTLARE